MLSSSNGIRGQFGYGPVKLQTEVETYSHFQQVSVTIFHLLYINHQNEMNTSAQRRNTKKLKLVLCGCVVVAHGFVGAVVLFKW